MYNGHLQATAAASIVAVSAILFNTRMTLGLLLMPFLVFEAIYYYDRYRDIDRDEATNQARTKHLRRYQKLIPQVIASLLLAALIIGWWFGSLQALVFMGLVALLGLLYPIVFKNITKHLPLFKNFYVASVFALLIFFPFIYQGEPIARDGLAAGLFLFVLGESLITQVLLDIKDRPSDRRYNLQTLPAMLTPRQTMYFLGSGSAIMVLGVIVASRLLPALMPLTPLAIGSLLANSYATWAVASRRRGIPVVGFGKYLLWPFISIVL